MLGQADVCGEKSYGLGSLRASSLAVGLRGPYPPPPEPRERACTQATAWARKTTMGEWGESSVSTINSKTCVGCQPFNFQFLLVFELVYSCP